MKFRKKPVIIEAMLFTGVNRIQIEQVIDESAYQDADNPYEWFMDLLEGHDES